MSDVRKPAVAGRFYKGTEDALNSQIEQCFLDDHGSGEIPEVEDGGSKDMIGLISPHAGYPYSGPVAAHGFSKLAKSGKPDDVVILGPNHSGFGAEVSFDNSEKWRTPLGDVEIDEGLRNDILGETKRGELDSTAHMREHSLEVQLPFLQYLFEDDFRMVPICLKRQDLETAESIGEAIAEAGEGRDLLVIASTDFTHYESPENVGEKDSKVLEKIDEWDWEGVNRMASSEKHTVCGYGPVSAALLAAKELGGGRIQLYKHATSGDIGGPSREVVGYASVGMLKE